MKKIFLLIFVLQLTVSYGQSTDWGPWETAACFKGLQFRTRPMSRDADNFNKYIQFRNNYPKKIAFSYVVKEGSKETDDYIKEYGGQYRSEIKANSTDDGLMWISLKTNKVPYLAVGYVRLLEKDQLDQSQQFETCDDRKYEACLLCKLHPRFDCPNYDKNKDPGKPIEQSQNHTSSQSVEELENIIIKNLQRNLKMGTTHYDIDNKNTAATYINIIELAADRKPPRYPGSASPNTLYIYYYEHGTSRLYGDRFIDLRVEKRLYKGQNLLHFTQNKKGQETGTFLYNFGANDENFIELINAIERLKNPTGKSVNTQNPISLNTTKQDEQHHKQAKANTFIAKLTDNLTAETKNPSIIKQNILEYFKGQDYPVFNQVSYSETGTNVYYFNESKSLYLYENQVDNTMSINFKNPNIEMGKQLYELIKSKITYGKLQTYHDGETVYKIEIDVNQDIKLNKSSANFQITSPKNYSILNIYPRITDVSWASISNATDYELIVEISDDSDFNTTRFRKKSRYLTKDTHYKFEGGGAQVHRYRVIAKNGDEIIAETDWNLINYKQ